MLQMRLKSIRCPMLVLISVAFLMTIVLFYVDTTYLSKIEIYPLAADAKAERLNVRSRTESSNSELPPGATGVEQLVAVIMVTRHGARTPLHIITEIEEAEYKRELLEPFVKAQVQLKTLNDLDRTQNPSFHDQRSFLIKLRGGAGQGQLTQVGERQMYELGRRLRDRYVNELHWLSSKYDAGEIYARSTHFRRTINSAKSLLAGLYTESHLDVPKNAFLIHVQDLQSEDLFPNPWNCTYLSHVLGFFDLYSPTSDTQYKKSLIELNDKLMGRVDGDASKGNDTKRTKYSFTMFRDDMMARQVHDKPIPQYLQSWISKSDQYSNTELSANHKYNIKQSCGLVLTEFRNYLKTSWQESAGLERQKPQYVGAKPLLTQHKFRLYSAHDSTLNCLLLAFDLINATGNSWPPFAANLIIESWKNTTDIGTMFYVRLNYCGNPVRVPRCSNSTVCNMNDFMQILEQNCVEKQEYHRLCSSTFKPNELVL